MPVSFGGVPELYQANGYGRKAAELEAGYWKPRKAEGSSGVRIVGKGKGWRLKSAARRDKGRIGYNEGGGNVRIRLN